MTLRSAIHRQWKFDLPITEIAVTKNGRHVALAMGDGSLRLFSAREDVEQYKSMVLHDGVSLSLTPDSDAHAFLSGGDDGKVFIIDPELEAPTLLAEHKSKWIDHVASSPEGCRAYSVGKDLILIDEEGKATPFHQALPSNPGGLAFSPNGKRIAVSHYNGVSLFWINAPETPPTKLLWKGSHRNLCWHPDGKTLVTSLQENALHGWRLSDQKEMQMQGYAAKIQVMYFSNRGRYLVTSGADQVICWPFFAGGPWGKTPLTLGGQGGRLVRSIAPHPEEELVAAGYDDGMIILAPLDGRMEILIKPPVAEKGSGVLGLKWGGENNNCLFAALENCYLLLFTMDSVRSLVTYA